ncbi:MAG: glutathione S-transferase C-terminal domain-containing protein [Pseudomonadota bacterium]
MAEHPRLITFGISHFCEKARWALDWHRIDYQEECWVPGLHVLSSRLAGARSSALPLLLSSREPVQGSGAILDWASRHGNGPELNHPDAAGIEERADNGIGIHLRHYVYSICLPRSPESVRPALYLNLGHAKALAGRATWPLVRRLMIKGFRITPETPERAKARFETELDWLDDLLSDGRPFLAGARFTRADLAVASLLSPLTRPAQMAVYRKLELPAELELAFGNWMQRPSAKWAAGLYRTHRRESRAR